MPLLSKRSTAVIDGIEKRNGWLNLEFQSSHVIERRSEMGRGSLFVLGTLPSLTASLLCDCDFIFSINCS